MSRKTNATRLISLSAPCIELQTQNRPRFEGRVTFAGPTSFWQRATHPRSPLSPPKRDCRFSSAVHKSPDSDNVTAAAAAVIVRSARFVVPAPTPCSPSISGTVQITFRTPAVGQEHSPPVLRVSGRGHWSVRAVPVKYILFRKRSYLRLRLPICPVHRMFRCIDNIVIVNIPIDVLVRLWYTTVSNGGENIVITLL